MIARSVERSRPEQSAAPRASTTSRGSIAVAHGPVPRALWFATMTMATILLVFDRIGPGLPTYVAPSAAALVTGAVAAALAHRTGGRPFVSLAVTLALGAVAVALDRDVLTAGMAFATAVLTGLLAVLVTTPAIGVLRAIREVAIVTGLAVVGALAVAGYAPQVDADRFRYLAVGVALVGVLGLVSGLGAGLHGLGRRGAVLLVAGTLLLIAVIAYGEAVSRWANSGVVDSITDLRSGLRTHLYAVPHPMETLIGYPALLWGVFMRARRRQGWWVCVFAVAATVSTACALVDPGVELGRAVVGSVYSLVLGLLLGYLVIRVDLYVSGSRGSRARRDEEAHALRPEPYRTRSLR